MTVSPGKKTGSPPQIVGVKRSAPSLLPAFEPCMSSPSLPRPAKRVRSDPTHCSPSKVSPLKYRNTRQQYPTPVPTSSTGIISSSPPQVVRTRRPGMTRAFSSASERAPLCSVPTIELDASGSTILMGRSGKAAHYQLSTHKAISRVHVQARYIPADPPAPAKVEIVCTGWNGVKIHCQGKAWELGKDSSFTSESQDADIMVDVQDARVLLQWPKLGTKPSTPADTDSAQDSENSPQRVSAPFQPRSPFSSPLRQQARLRSPVSPSPAVNAASGPISLNPFPDLPAMPTVRIYVDPEPDEEAEEFQDTGKATQSTQFLSQPLGSNLGLSMSSSQSNADDFSDQDEENDPIVHSFGPFGDNLQARMANFTAGSSPGRRERLEVLKEASVSPQALCSKESTVPDAVEHPVMNHVINQLAYSRLSSTPLSIIMGNLPASLKNDSPNSKENQRLTIATLKNMIDRTQCIGEITRQGKDAAGQPLESEYYYIAELDEDHERRDTFEQLKPGLRGCRKQHKVSCNASLQIHVC
jgi:hypothetical protein